MKNLESENSMENERKTMVARVAGAKPENEKIILGLLAETRKNPEKMPQESEKTEEDISIIRRLNQKIKEYVEEYGGSWIEVPPELIHIFDIERGMAVDDEKMAKEVPGGETRIIEQDIVAIRPAGDKLKFVCTLVHEMLHYNSFMSLTEGKKELKNRRAGLNVYIKDRKKPFFTGLDEAVITELEARFDKKFFKDFRFLEKEWLEREVVKEFYRAKGKGELAENIQSGQFVMDKNGEKRVQTYLRGYTKERSKLYWLIDEIFKRNPGEFKSVEDVFALFARAGISGKLLPLARVVEKTFGKGAFRKMGELVGRASKGEKNKA